MRAKRPTDSIDYSISETHGVAAHRVDAQRTTLRKGRRFHFLKLHFLKVDSGAGRGLPREAEAAAARPGSGAAERDGGAAVFTWL